MNQHVSQKQHRIKIQVEVYVFSDTILETV